MGTQRQRLQTLLFEQAALTLVREMPVNAAARIMEITDKRLWRVVQHYVAKAVASFDLSAVQAIGLDETASKRGHNYVTVFIDMERRDKPVLFVTPGKGKETVKEFKAFLEKHDGDPEQILEVVCDMSPAFLSGVAGQLPKAQVTVDWFHIVQTFTRALDDVRKAEGRVKALPKHLRWAVLKRGDVDGLTTNQLKAMAELLDQGLDTATAWRVKERLRWVRQAPTPRAAKWRITRFINYASELVGGAHLLEPVRKALQTLRTHAERVVRRWTSTYTNARLEGLNGLFQAARARARGYRNTETFMTMIYLIASPAGKILESTKCSTPNFSPDQGDDRPRSGCKTTRETAIAVQPCRGIALVGDNAATRVETSTRVVHGWSHNDTRRHDRERRMPCE